MAGEEAAASQKAAAAKAIKDECEAELAVAMPLLDSAIQALNTLTKSDITEVRGLRDTPAILLTMGHGPAQPGCKTTPVVKPKP